MNYFKGIFLFLFMSVLYGCSGDDSDLNPDPAEQEEPTVVTGVFIDSEVTGLHYSTETQSGVTNSKGEYNYIEGETVTFSVGEITLGDAPAGPKLSPVSIASTDDASVETQEVKNIAAFLQTLDSDNDPSNGILIETATVEAISTSSIDFTGPIIKILGEIVAEVNLANDSNLSVVYPETAAEHLAGTLGDEYEADDPVFNEFIPYLENQYGQKLNSYYWVHETDEEGKLVRSHQYEKYPNRYSYEVVYMAWNELGQPVMFEEIAYNFQGEANTRTTVEILYSDNGSVESSISTIPDYTPEGDYWIQKWYTQFDEEDRVVQLVFSRNPNAEPSSRVEFIYDEEGNLSEELAFDVESGVQTRRLVYTYTEWGDKASETLFDASGNETIRLENYYRDDRTLEKQVWVSPNGSSSTTNYDENEERLDN